MENLPDEILLKIICYNLPIIYCNISDFLKYRLVSKHWKKLVDDIETSNQYMNNIFKCKNSKIVYRNKYFNNLKLLYELDCYYNIVKHYNKFFLDLLSLDFIRTLPICYFKNSRCLDNMCSQECYENHHNLNKYVKDIDNGIMRGIDDKGRHYILIFYVNLTTNEILYEFLYHKNEKKNRFDMVTSTGIFNKNYIGLNSFNYLLLYNYEYYKELSCDSYSYLIRLLKNMPCGVMKYNCENDMFYESFDEIIKIL